MSRILMLNKLRTAFPALAEPEAIGDGDPAYGARFVIEPNSPHVALIENAMLEAAKHEWKDEGADILAMLKEEKKVCFERGPYRNKKTGKAYAGFEGKFNLGARTAANKPRPSVFDQFNNQVGDTGRELTPAEKLRIEQLIYSGCYTHAKVEIWAQDNRYGRRINCSLLGVMFAEDGESFGGGARPAGADDFAGMAKAPMDGVGGSASDAEDVI